MRYVPEHPEKGTPEAYAWAEKMRAARQKKARTRHAVRQAGLKTEAEFFGPGGPLEVKALQKHKLNPSPKYSIVCQANGCTFLREKLSKRQANQEASSHQSMTGHEVAMVVRNPGEKWHEGEENVAYRYKKQAKDQLEKAFFAGVEAAHHTSKSAARKLGMNPRRPYIITPAEYKAWFEKHAQTFDHRDALACAKKLVKHEKASVKKNPIAIYNPPAKEAGTIYNNAIEIRAQKTGGPLKGHYRHVFGKNVRIIGLTDGTVLLQHKDGKPLWITRKDYERSGRKH